MDNLNVAPAASGRQEFQPNSISAPLNSLIEDLRQLRDRGIRKDRYRRSAILIGQLLLLARGIWRYRLITVAPQANAYAPTAHQERTRQLEAEALPLFAAAEAR